MSGGGEVGSHNATSSCIVVRPATRTDIKAFYPDGGTSTVKAWVGEVGGRIVGIGGLAFAKGRWVAFLDLTEEARPYKISIVRAARAAMSETAKSGHRVIHAGADIREPAAKRFLTSLGFEPDMRTGLFRWRA
jgi:hypothetical protein